MHINLKTLFLALLFAGISPFASALSLGDGQILSYIGEPFSANIALTGDYDKNVKFYQVGNAECRSSIIGRSTNGCDSLYEGQLSFAVRRRPDGQYFLRVTGEKSDELFYRIIIKYASTSSGTAFNAFEFLPEFKADAEAPPAAEIEPAVNAVPHKGKYGGVRGKIVDAQSDDESAVSAKIAPAKAARAKVASSHVKPEASDQPNSGVKRSARPVEVQPALRTDTRLQIKKYGEYADDIHALQKENGEIEEQIALLEKHIGLLRQVIRLKSEAGVSSVADAGVMAVASASVPAPVRIAVQSLPVTRRVGMLTWILLAAVVVLSVLLLLMYRKMKRFTSGSSTDAPGQSVFSPSPLNARKSLDLTGSFDRPKW